MRSSDEKRDLERSMKNMESNNGKVYSVEELNFAAQTDAKAFLDECDADFAKRISAAVDEIIKKSHGGGVIMLSGPSSAGKTTTSMMIDALLEKHGNKSEKISLDDFFLPADETPFDENGKRDFEGISALNLEEVKNCLYSLSEYGYCDMPKYDFVKKRPADFRQRITLSHDGFVIIEGLHALNPLLTTKIKKSNVTKLYLNIESSVVIDGVTLDGQTLRMLRRLVRDTQYRSIDAERCLDLWDSVTAGERKNIFPFVGYSDITIDSFHKCELGIIGAKAIPILLTVPSDSPHYDMAQNMVRLLKKVSPITAELLDEKSLLTEFVGGGSYVY